MEDGQGAILLTSALGASGLASAPASLTANSEPRHTSPVQQHINLNDSIVLADIVALSNTGTQPAFRNIVGRGSAINSQAGFTALHLISTPGASFVASGTEQNSRPNAASSHTLEFVEAGSSIAPEATEPLGKKLLLGDAVFAVFP